MIVPRSWADADIQGSEHDQMTAFQRMSRVQLIHALLFSLTCKSNLRTWCHQAKRFELNAVSAAMIRPGIKLRHRQSAALNRSGVAVLRNQQNRECRVIRPPISRGDMAIS